MVKSHQIKSNYRVPRKNKEDTYGAPPGFSRTVLATKMCTSSNWHSVYIIILWAVETKQLNQKFELKTTKQLFQRTLFHSILNDLAYRRSQ